MNCDFHFIVQGSLQSIFSFHYKYARSVSVYIAYNSSKKLQNQQAKDKPLNKLVTSTNKNPNCHIMIPYKHTKIRSTHLVYQVSTNAYSRNNF